MIAYDEVGWRRLRIAAETYAGFQKLRVGTGNRINPRAAEGDEYDAAARAMAEVDFGPWSEGLLKQEKDALKILQDVFREVVPPSIQEWAGSVTGIAKGGNPGLIARLLGHLGHPRIAVPKHWEAGEDRGSARKRVLVPGEPFERSIGQLWQYCGHGAPKRRGSDDAPLGQLDVLANGNPACKMLTHLLAQGCVKAGVRKDEDGARVGITPQGVMYLATKAEYSSRGHLEPCRGGWVSAGPGKVVYAKCKVLGEDGKIVRYAEAGDPFQPGHIDAIALRALGKEILRDLWLAAGEGASVDTKPIPVTPLPAASRGHRGDETHTDAPADTWAAGGR